MHRFIFLIPYISVIIGLHYLSNAWAAILLYNAGMLAVLRHRKFNWQSFFQGWHKRDGFLLILLAATSGVSMVLFKDMFLEEGQLANSLSGLGLSGANWTIFAIYFSVASPILEEAFWRGLQGSSSKVVDKSDLFFAGYHVLVLLVFTSWLISMLSFLGLVFIAWIWRRQNLRHQGLAVPVASHFAADVSIILAATYLLGSV